MKFEDAVPLLLAPVAPSGDRRPPGWRRAVGASVAGRSHHARAIPCQDAWNASAPDDQGVPCLVVADGAGSRDRAAEGSRLAADVTLGILGRYLRRVPGSPSEWRDLLERSLSIVHDEFHAGVVELASDGDPSPFATTLAFAILAPPWVGIASVGNSFAVLRTTRRETGVHHLVLPPPPPAGEFANQTTFLTSQDALERSRIEVLHAPGLDGFTMATDGCIDAGVVYRRGVPFRPNRPFFDEVFSVAEASEDGNLRLESFLAGDEVAGLSPDDKTVVAIARRGAG